ncbi:MAG: DMT family transporter [Limnohabitans sp.]|nr:DMT family transporter [Limnohabitans sp.]
MPETRTPATTERLALFMSWLTPLLWTANLWAARTSPGVVEPNTLALGRWLMAGLVLAWFCRGELWAHRHVLRRKAWHYLVLGALGMWICGAWVYLAGHTTGAMNISLIYAASPVMIVLGSAYWLGESLGWRKGLGVAMALTGVVHVVVQGAWERLASFQLVPGDLWVFAAAVAWAAYSLLQRGWHHMPSATAQLAANSLAGSLVLLPFAVLELADPNTPPLSTTAFILMGVTAVIPGLGAYWIYGWTLRVLGASRVSVTMYLGPLYAAVMAWGILGEPLAWHHFWGAVLILSGVGIAMSPRRAAAGQPSPGTPAGPVSPASETSPTETEAQKQADERASRR